MESKRSIRDFNYNHSDIFLAIIILLIAAVVVIWRINIIMDYPKTLSAENIADELQAADTSGDTISTSNTEKTTTTGSVKATWNGDTLSEDITVELKGKSSADDIQTLINAGLFVNDTDFNNTCREAKLKVGKLKKGSHTFRAGMTKSDIAKMVIK
jgi:cell division protein YceG involved in septum cleavage